MTLFSREVLPRLQELRPPETEQIDAFERLRERAAAG